MNKDQIKQAKQDLLDINKTITGLDPAIRLAAFDLLAPLYFDACVPPRDEEESKKKNAGRKKTPHAEKDRGEFFGAHDHSRPKDNVYLIAAWFYSEYGVIPLTSSLIRECAHDVGLTIPERPDNTMRQAKTGGKNMYRQKNSGWQLTVNGEAYVKEKYGVKKGNKALPEGDTD